MDNGDPDSFQDPLYVFHDPFQSLPPSPTLPPARDAPYPDPTTTTADADAAIPEEQGIVSYVPPTMDSSTEGHTTIWGTNIDIDTFGTRSKVYMEKFLYAKIAELNEPGSFMDLDMAHMESKDMFLSTCIQCHPTTCIPFFQVVVADLWFEIHRGMDSRDAIMQRYPTPVLVAPYNFPEIS
eukprot:PhF_6_TR2301/c0_g1_i2/m.4042